MNKKRLNLFLAIGILLIISVSLVSASWFDDFFGKITGKASSSEYSCIRSNEPAIGNANGVGGIDNADATVVNQIVAGLIPYPADICCADVNQDDSINAADTSLILQIAAGTATSPDNCRQAEPTVTCLPTITTSSLSGGTVGTSYSTTLTATGENYDSFGRACKPYYWYVSGGALPAGLSLMSNGVISGTPTTAGTYSFIVAAADQYIQQTTTGYFRITIVSASSIPTPPTYSLNVKKTGTGTVTSSPTGINCGTDCIESYNSGTSVTLTATAASGSTFAGWSGATCTEGTQTSLTCTFAMSSAKTVTATFNIVTTTPTNPPTATLTANPTFVSPGKSSILTWSFSGATSCEKTAIPSTSEWQGTLTIQSGYQIVTPSTTTGYTLNCTNYTGSTSKSVTVTVGSSIPSQDQAYLDFAEINLQEAKVLSGGTIIITALNNPSSEISWSSSCGTLNPTTSSSSPYQTTFKAPILEKNTPPTTCKITAKSGIREVILYVDVVWTIIGDTYLIKEDIDGYKFYSSHSSQEDWNCTIQSTEVCSRVATYFSPDYNHATDEAMVYLYEYNSKDNLNINIENYKKYTTYKTEKIMDNDVVILDKMGDHSNVALWANENVLIIVLQGMLGKSNLPLEVIYAYLNKYPANTGGTNLRDTEGENEEEVSCDNGCLLNGKCYSPEKRVSGNYCDATNQWITQLSNGFACDSNFQCISEICSSGVCSDGNFIQRVWAAIREFFSPDDETSANLCGNDIINSGEECDDGNKVSGDGCSSTCKIESVAGNFTEKQSTGCVSKPNMLEPAKLCTGLTSSVLCDAFSPLCKGEGSGKTWKCVSPEGIGCGSVTSKAECEDANTGYSKLCEWKGTRTAIVPPDIETKVYTVLCTWSNSATFIGGAGTSKSLNFCGTGPDKREWGNCDDVVDQCEALVGIATFKPGVLTLKDFN